MRIDNTGQKNLVLVAALLALAGCVTSDIRPQPKINPVQAQQEIPAAELLDIGIHVFDPGIPASPTDEEALAKKRIFPGLRKAEARWMPVKLRATLEASSQWGAVRVVPDGSQYHDVMVTGRIVESTGMKVELEVSARDSQGRVWLDKFRSGAVADLGAYKTDAALKVRDPFENVYATIANALLAARDKLSAAERRDIRRVTDMRFALDIAPSAAQGYLAKDAAGLTRLTRLPADGDPVMQRVASIRERDNAVVDTLDSYSANYYEKLSESYGQFRRTSFDEIDKEERAKASARTRMALGAATVLASVLAPEACSSTNYNCQDLESVARTAGAAGGVAAIVSGYKKYADAKVHAQALSELANSFEAEATPQVVEVEGRTLKLTGTAEEQYREWRRLLAELYRAETGGVSTGGASNLPTPPPTTPAAPAPPKQ
jgi:hypothetical protein